MGIGLDPGKILSCKGCDKIFRNQYLRAGLDKVLTAAPIGIAIRHDEEKAITKLVPSAAADLILSHFCFPALPRWAFL